MYMRKMFCLFTGIYKCSLTEDSHESLGVVEDGCDPQEPLDPIHHQGWVRSKQGAVYNMELQGKREKRVQKTNSSANFENEIF